MGEIQDVGSTQRLSHQCSESAGTLLQRQKKKKSEWRRENASLRKLSSNLHRDAHDVFFSTRSDLQQSAKALLAQEQADTEVRRKEVAAVRVRLVAQKAAMSKIEAVIRRLATDVDGTEGPENIMEGLEDELYEFKCTMRKGYDELVAQEKSLSCEMGDLRERLKEWEKKPRGDEDLSMPNQAAGSNRPLAAASAPAATAASNRRGGGGGHSARSSRGKNGTQEVATAGVVSCVAAEGGGEYAKESDGGGSSDSVCARGGDSPGSGGEPPQRGPREVETYVDAVERINSLIRREGGPCGGWPQHEHDCFLRLWTRARSRGPSSGTRPPPSSPADRAAVSFLLQRAQTMLPARSAEEVSEHLARHRRYGGYNEEKRRLAKAWREQKRHEQRADAEDTLTMLDEHRIDGHDDDNNDGSDKNKARRPSTAAETRTAASAAAAAAAAAAAEREAKKKEVDEWRAAKFEKERERREREELRRANEGVKADEERRRLRRVHEQVSAYRLEREREDDRRREVERMLAREQKRTTHLSQAELEKRAKTDVLKARRRREEAAERQRQLEEAEDKKKAVAKERWAGVEADRARILRGTKASKERVLEPEDLDDREDERARLPAHSSRIPIGGRDLRFNAGRAVPAWMRGCA